MKRHVMITGIGTICSAGRGSDKLAEALARGLRCFSPISDPRLAHLRATHAGLVGPVDPPATDPPQVRVLDRNVHLALAAAREAVAGAGLEGKSLGPGAAVVFGTCSGGMLSIERYYESLCAGRDIIDEDLRFSKSYGTTAKVLAWATGARGPALNIITACAAGAGAIAQGVDLIRSGLVDLVLAGGSDTFAASTLTGFDALKATCEGMCTPFSSNIGLNLGEGAAFFILEAYEHASRRNAEILGEIKGVGLSNDAYHPTAPDPGAKGQVAAMRRALEDAGVGPDDIDYVNAHGTGTRANDPTESRAISKLLGQRAFEVPISSTKSMIGHCLGGAGALEATATLLAARGGVIPPTAGFDQTRDGCAAADYVPDAGRPWRGRLALSNNFGFAGHNACLVIDTAPATPKESTPPLRKTPKVVLTGMGAVSAVGFGVEPLTEEDTCAVLPIDRFAVPTKNFEAGLVPELDLRKIDRRLDLKGMDLCSRYATLAARGALESAGFKPRPSIMENVGLVLGLAAGPSQGEREHLTAVFESGFAIESLGAFPYVVPNSVGGNVSRALLLRGHNTVIASGRGAGLAAVVSAAMAVEQGHGTAVLAACADELSETVVRDGFATGQWGPGTDVDPGEGAAAWLLEEEEAALRRGATPKAQLLGYALGTDADDPRSAEGGSLARVLVTAAKRAGVALRDLVGLAVGQAGGALDQLEQWAIQEVFGQRMVPTITLGDRIGLAEASLAVFNASYLVAKGYPGALIGACCLSEEGYASAIVLRIL